MSDPECCIPGLPPALISAASGSALGRPVPVGVGWALDKQSQISRDNLHLLHTPMMTDPAERPDYQGGADMARII